MYTKLRYIFTSSKSNNKELEFWPTQAINIMLQNWCSIDPNLQILETNDDEEFEKETLREPKGEVKTICIETLLEGDPIDVDNFKIIFLRLANPMNH